MRNIFGTLVFAILFSVLTPLSAHAQSKLPARALGCWYDSQGSQWSYGFFENFASYDSQFWSYDSIVEDKNNIRITITSGEQTIIGGTKSTRVRERKVQKLFSFRR